MSTFKRVPHGALEILSGRPTAEEYLRMQQVMGRFYLKGFMAELTKLKQSGDFLEIGSGPGYQTAQVAKRCPGARIRVLEPSPDMITIAGAYMKQQGVDDRVRFTCGVVEDEAAVGALGEFDLVYSTFSLHHWKEPARAISNIYGTLRNDGVALIYDFIRNRLMYWATWFRKGIADSVRASYTKGEIKHLLGQSHIKSYCIETNFPYLKLLMHQKGSLQS